METLKKTEEFPRTKYYTGRNKQHNGTPQLKTNLEAVTQPAIRKAYTHILSESHP